MLGMGAGQLLMYIGGLGGHAPGNVGHLLVLMRHFGNHL